GVRARPGLVPGQRRRRAADQLPHRQDRELPGEGGRMRPYRPAARRRTFTIFWTGQTVSMVGDQLTLFVVPTLMIFALHATPLQVGLVGMAQYLGIPVLGPVAGVLIDRWNKR